MPKVKHYISERRHAMAAGGSPTDLDENGDPKYAGLKPGDNVDQATFDNLYPNGTEAPEPTPTRRDRIIGTLGAVDLDSMKVDDLKSMAADRGIDGYSTMKKGELVEALST